MHEGGVITIAQSA